MSKRLFPAFMYTPTFGWVLLVAMLWLNFKALDVFHGMARLPFVVFTTVGVLFLGRELLRGKDFLKDPVGAARTIPGPRYENAYLVLHINIKQSPPVVVYAHIYSSSAKDLTGYGSEAKADLYRVQAATFAEALHEMEQITPLYFPWVVPLMTRDR